MNTFCLPVNFGERFEDRTLLEAARAEGVGRAEAWVAMVRAWQDFATDRSTVRVVPADDVALGGDRTVRVIESYCEWPGAPGRFIELALAAGFMVGQPDGNGGRRLALAGFAEANAKAPDSRTLGRLGGLGRSRTMASRAAQADADDMLELFRRTGHSLVAEMGPDKIHLALVFIGQVARLMRWSHPGDQAFLTALVPKALETLAVLGGERDLWLAWLVAHREDDSLPGRIDLLFAQAGPLLEQARAWKKA